MSGLALINEDHVNFRRWSVSVALAILLHGAIAVALLNSYRPFLPIRPGEPFVINVDLAPPAAEFAPEGRQVGSAVDRPERPSERVITDAPMPAPIGGAQTNGESGVPALAAPRDVTVPGAPAPPKDATEGSGTQTTTLGSGGGMLHAAPNTGRGGAQEISPPRVSPFDAPLDTSITVLHGRSPKNAAGGLAQKQKKLILLRPSKHAGTLSHPRSPGVANAPATVVNAVGARVQDRVRAAHARAVGHGAEAKNAIGGAVARGLAGSGINANATDSTVVNAIGMTVRVQPGVLGTSPGEHKTGALASTGAATNRSAINGRSMVRPGARAGAIGGPAHSVAGALNGSDVQIRRP